MLYSAWEARGHFSFGPSGSVATTGNECQVEERAGEKEALREWKKKGNWKWKILLRMVLNCLKISMPASQLPKLGCEFDVIEIKIIAFTNILFIRQIMGIWYIKENVL